MPNVTDANGVTWYEPEQFFVPRTRREKLGWVMSSIIEDIEDEKWSGDGPGPPEREIPAHEARQVAALLTSLDPEETSGFGPRHCPSPERNDPQLAHAQLLWDWATCDRERDIATSIGECGTILWVALDDDGPCTIRNRCKHRQCQQCANYRGKQIGSALTKLMDRWPRTKFITLTRKARDLSLREQVQSLLHDFNSLRRTALWKASVKEGAFTVEITRANDRGHWHVHLHILADSHYIPQQALSAAWKHVTKDSGVVWVRAAKPSDAKYLAKYVSKGTTAPVENFERWAYHNELTGVRMCGTFGGAPSLKSLEDEPNHTLIAPLVDVQRWAREGDRWAQELLARITERLVSGTSQDNSLPVSTRGPDG